MVIIGCVFHLPAMFNSQVRQGGKVNAKVCALVFLFLFSCPPPSPHLFISVSLTFVWVTVVAAE